MRRHSIVVFNWKHTWDIGNTAWVVRNYRMVGIDDNKPMSKLCYAVKKPLRVGKPTEKVVRSLVNPFFGRK